MPIELKLDAEKRTDMGKGASRRLRRAHKVPAVLYGGNNGAVALTLNGPQVTRLMEEESFYSQILTLAIDGKKEQVIVKDIQRHPFKPLVSHIDLQRVVAGQLFRSRIPLHFVGQEELMKTQKGVLQHEMIDVEIECLPQDLPQNIEVDVSGLTVGASIHLSELQLPAGVSLTAIVQDSEHDVPVVSLLAARVAEADLEAEKAEAAGEEAEGEAEEGGAAATD